ncbi:MAG: hypothetical protein ACI87E_002607 [Mariniblastus sp.]|jgi:hypothetical protein
MDLIYIILSVFLRLSPAVRKLSSVSSGRKNRGDVVELAFWIPLVGWVSVSVQHLSEAQWLTWRVRKVNSVHFSLLDLFQKQAWRVDSSRRRRKKPLRRSSDPSDDQSRNVE